MPNIATVLKQEITRLARKESRSQVEPLRKANAQYRRDIAELKRQVRTMKKQIDFLDGRERKRLKHGTASPDSADLRFSPSWLKSHRRKLGFSAADYAELVGVSSQTIYNWEQGRSKPQAQQLAALSAVRGMGKREAEQLLDG